MPARDEIVVAARGPSAVFDTAFEVLDVTWTPVGGGASAIGGRLVDLAVDPASPVADSVVGRSTVLGVYGPILVIGTWLDLLRGSTPDRGSVAWLLQERRTVHLLASVARPGVAWLMTRATILRRAGPRPGRQPSP